MRFSKIFKGKKQDTSTSAVPPAAEQPARVFNAREIEQAVIEVLRTVYDPEIPVNVYELGLVYETDVNEAGRVLVQMTLTSPGCPVAGSLIPEIEQKIALIPGVTDVFVELVWDPPWDPSRMSEAARLQLGFL